MHVHMHRHRRPAVRWRVMRTSGFWLAVLPVAAVAALAGVHGWAYSLGLMTVWSAVLAWRVRSR